MAPYPKITICLTAHRCDKLFRRAVHSIKQQQYDPYEVILVIDSRTTEDNCKYWLNGIPNSWKVIWTEQDDSGAAIVRNMGIYHATGDWILFLDGDDFLVPSCLSFYVKQIPTTKADVIVEFTALSLIHNGISVTKNVPADKEVWNEAVKFHTKSLYAGTWKKGEFPVRPLLVKNFGRKYFPLDFAFMEDKVFILLYMLEERRVLLSDFCGYIINDHPKSLTKKYSSMGFGIHPDELRFRRIAANIYINGWTVRDKIFEQNRTYTYLSDADREYIDSTAAYFNVPTLD